MGESPVYLANDYAVNFVKEINMAKKPKEPKIPETREEAVTGKSLVDESAETLDKDSREYHVKYGK